MRVGELTALHWDEVDLDKAMITVKYNLYRLDGEYQLSTPKTKSSARVIALPPQLVEILREQKVKLVIDICPKPGIIIIVSDICRKL